MGDNDDSSKAAQSAQETESTNNDEPQPGPLRRLFGWIGGSGEERATPPDRAEQAPDRPVHGMINLRRMRVEDVATPKAEIIAVPSTITKDDLVQVFRDSGMTRLPVFDGTLDTPVGMAHLKDFAL